MKKWLLYVMAALSLMGVGPSSRSVPPVLRLHVIANSDGEEDQRVKLQVRDRVVEYMNAWAGATSTFPEAKAYAEEHLEEIQRIAREVLRENGLDYEATASVGIYPFPDRTYGEVAFPAGDYYAVKVELGRARGANWWCVLFPPLCFLPSAEVEEDWKEEDGVEYRSFFGELLGLYQ
jgi:stage II sporulation protein R